MSEVQREQFSFLRVKYMRRVLTRIKRLYIPLMVSTQCVVDNIFGNF